MARAAVKAKQSQRATAQQPSKQGGRRGGRRKHASGGNPNQQLFFSRLRRRAKFMYFLLAILFAITFAFLGVGSGTGGLDQLFANLNIFGGGGGTSVSKALKEVKQHPSDPKSFRDLATAYEGKGDTASAIVALGEYTALAPKDAAALNELGSLQLGQASTLTTDYQNAYAAEQLAAPSATFLPTGKLGTAIGESPIEQAVATQANTNTGNIAQQIGESYNEAIATYQRLAKLEPDNANVQFQLAQAAQTGGNNTVAIAAYRDYLKLNPDSSSANQIKALIKQLTPAPAKTSTKK
jgi:tetratricopeptide (TPR) repeat protein